VGLCGGEGVRRGGVTGRGAWRGGRGVAGVCIYTYNVHIFEFHCKGTNVTYLPDLRKKELESF
jgi:hypothetical protein